MPAEETSLKVCVRVRPFNQRERDRNATSVITMRGGTTTITNPEDGTERSFTFDKSYNSYVGRDDPGYASQSTLWDDIGEGVLNDAWAGYNSSLFAYGQVSYATPGYRVCLGCSERRGRRGLACVAHATLKAIFPPPLPGPPADRLRQVLLSLRLRERPGHRAHRVKGHL